MSTQIIDNIEALRTDINAACKKSGRNPNEIILVAVSKTVGITEIEEAVKSGCLDYGENRVNDLISKYRHFHDRVGFHMIGHLQTNKVRDIVGKAKLIHSVDSLRLLKEIERRAAYAGAVQDILIQLDISGEDSKFGASEDEMLDMFKLNEEHKNVIIKGLMTMAPLVANPEETRWVFKKLKDVFIDTGRKTFYNTVMEYTSMGMSNDFKVAIEEGAHIIRVGSRIFHNTH